mmetsp:Transcript_16912/g.45832  ORF Transcript_16912/g.45832 Transcript_16912/m.45832 type:complete len:205 (-) Transcript_16912:187-801(-)|eukprot:CAMPEP_0194503452 /NCGR_PEP_ID=MMETSP0253-20130528/28390_1 /TAXON_ID=2966 /ORGANISM="Noctiluca scintillans" /LENGTH=204 /DNA_ID=CAMNT_0039345739 /DNA_START=52 /DNA_END=666 /DNA_ORIENTATION=+
MIFCGFVALLIHGALGTDPSECMFSSDSGDTTMMIQGNLQLRNAADSLSVNLQKRQQQHGRAASNVDKATTWKAQAYPQRMTDAMHVFQQASAGDADWKLFMMAVHGELYETFKKASCLVKRSDVSFTPQQSWTLQEFHRQATIQPEAMIQLGYRNKRGGRVANIDDTHDGHNAMTKYLKVVVEIFGPEWEMDPENQQYFEGCK